MKTFYDYWKTIPDELKNEYGPGAVVAAKLAWDAAMGEVLDILVNSQDTYSLEE